MPSASKYLKKKLELFSDVKCIYTIIHIFRNYIKNILKNLHLISDANCITTMVERNGNRTPKLGSLNQVIINIYIVLIAFVLVFLSEKTAPLREWFPKEWKFLLAFAMKKGEGGSREPLRFFFLHFFCLKPSRITP